MTNGFDSMRRLTRVAQWVSSAPTASADYAYDHGRLWRKTYGNNDQVTYEYDTRSWLRGLTMANGGATVLQLGFDWDQVSNLRTLTNMGTLTHYTYDALRQLTNEVYGGVSRGWLYDPVGNSQDWPEPPRQALYNADDELVLSSANVTIPVSGHVEPGANNSKWFNTRAESRGVTAQVATNTGNFTLPNVPLYPGTNSLLVTVTDVSGNSSQQTRTVINNRVDGYGYDGNGSRTKWTNGSTVWTCVWNWADQLTEVQSNGTSVLKCWYDGIGRRVAKEEVVGGQTKRWIYVYSGWNIIAVLNETGSLRETYTRGIGLAGDIGTIVAVTHHSGSSVTPGTYYVHHNHRGDVVMTRSGTTTFGTHAYAAYGAVRSQTGTKASRFLFSSKELDESVGLYYYVFRFYDPNLQRWLSRDPWGEEGGLNLYTFVNNNPKVMIDPLGLKDTPTDQFDYIGIQAATYAYQLMRRYGNVEYGGRICKCPCDNGGSYYVYMMPVRGTEKEDLKGKRSINGHKLGGQVDISKSPKCPQKCTQVGTYHSHPSNPFHTRPDDLIAAEWDSERSYVSAGTGGEDPDTVYVYNVFSGKESRIK